MKKPVLSLKPAAIAGLFIDHGEKIAFAAVAVPALLLAWWGIDALRSQAVRQDRTPKALSELTSQANASIESVRRVPANRLPARKPLAPLIDPWRPQQVKIAASPGNPSLLNRPLFTEMTKRTRPEVFPIEDLRAVAGIAVLPDLAEPAAREPALPAQPGDKDRPAGQADSSGGYGVGPGQEAGETSPPPPPQQLGRITPFVVVTGLIPAARQQAEYARRFGSTSFRDPQRDKPRWGVYLVERARIAPGEGLRWERMDVKDVEQANPNGRIGVAPTAGGDGETPLEQESLPQGFFLQPDDAEIGYAAGLPQRLDGPWGTATVHPWFIPRLEQFLADAASGDAEDQPAALLGFGELLEDPKAHADETFRLEGVVLDAAPERQRDIGLFRFGVRTADGGEAAAIRTIGLSTQLVFAVSDQWGRQLSVDGTTDKPRLCHLRVRLDMVGKTPVGRILAIELLDEAGAVADTRTEPNPGPPVGAEGFGPVAGNAAGGADGLGRGMLLADNRLFRFVDTAVKPGEAYRYRVKFAVRNPNVGLAAQHLADPAVAKGEFLVSEYSSEAEVRVPEPTMLVARTIDRDTAKKMRLRGEALEVMVLAPSNKTGNFALRSTITGLGGLANIDMDLNKSGDARFFGEKIDTGRLLVDARGAQDDRSGSRAPEPQQPIEMLFLRPDGTFEFVAAADSERRVRQYGSTLFRPGTRVPSDGRPERIRPREGAGVPR